LSSRAEAVQLRFVSSVRADDNADEFPARLDSLSVVAPASDDVTADDVSELVSLGRSVFRPAAALVQLTSSAALLAAITLATFRPWLDVKRRNIFNKYKMYTNVKPCSRLAGSPNILTPVYVTFV